MVPEKVSHEFRMVDTIDSVLIIGAGLLVAAGILRTVQQPPPRAFLMLLASDWIPRLVRYATPNTYIDLDAL